MRCFKSFFKHTWHPQQMDTPGRFSSPTKPCENNFGIHETELGELKTPPEPITTIVQGIPCRDGGCKRQVGLKGQSHHRLESPWHYLKTLFLIAIIVALVVWILVYVLLSHYDLL